MRTRKRVVARQERRLALVGLGFLLMTAIAPAGAWGQVQQWAAAYDGGSYDYATAMTVDGAGNVYVTGVTTTAATGDDFAIVKYDKNGVQKWARTYSNPGGWALHPNDYPVAIAVDGAGNVYVTGWSAVARGDTVYATVKYDQDGAFQWDAFYNGPGPAGDSFDEPVGLVVDGDGNVYVTGTSPSAAGHTDYATVKYNAAGVEQFVARFNGTGNGYDYARALARDEDGNLYVTGMAWADAGGYKFATVKYDGDLIEKWAKWYGTGGMDGARAMTLDFQGNIYVTGDIWVGGFDIASIMYDADGNKLWEKTYHDAENYSTVPAGIKVDGQGNIYVAGTATDPSYNNQYYLTLRYDPTGTFKWAQTYAGAAAGVSSNYPQAKSLALDAKGNIYVTGTSMEGTGADLFPAQTTLKYNRKGQMVWVQRDGNLESKVTGVGLAVDQGFNVYTLGSKETVAPSLGSDFRTVKYGVRTLPYLLLLLLY